MKTKFHSLLVVLALLASVYQADAQGTAFTYQGRLTSGGSPASGLYDFRFKLYTDPFGNFQVGSSYLTNAIPTTNGLFTTTVDFGAGIFTGRTNWLEVDVRTNGGGGYTILSPLQNLTPTPYAVFAESASNLSGTLSAAQLSGPVSSANLAGTYVNPVNLNNAGNNFNGSFNGNGRGLMNLNAWALAGNSGTSPTNGNFLGTTDNQPVELWVNGQRVFRLEPDTNNFGAPNVIGGAPNNYVDPGITGATIAGGGVLNYSATNGFEPGPGSNHVSAIWGTISGGRRNTVAADHSVIGGGHDNLIQALAYDSVIGGGSDNTISNSAEEAVIAGGEFNIAGGSAATVGGGFENSADSLESTIGGGAENTINANASGATISGGLGNYISSPYAIIPGGYANTAAGRFSFAAGQNAQANHDGVFVWSDDSASSSFPSVIQNEFAIRAAGGVRLVTSGAGMTLDGQPVATVAALSNVALRSGGNNFTGQQTVTGGMLGIGTASPQAALHVKGPDAGQFTLQNSADNSSWYFSDDVNDNLVFQPNTGVGAYIDRAGNYHNNSDVRLKQDITQLNGMLDKVLQLRPVSYHFRSAPEGTSSTFGLIAQEVEPLFPEIVGDRAGTKSLAYSELIPVTIRAIQELNQKLNNKDEEIQMLKLQNKSLTERLNDIEAAVKSITEKK